MTADTSSDTDPTPPAACYYERLGLAPDAGATAVERQWQRALSLHHHDSGGTEADLARLRAAYDTLSDRTDRRAYDAIREEFGKARAAALFEEWVADGRSGHPVSYYQDGPGDPDEATARQTNRGQKQAVDEDADDSEDDAAPDEDDTEEEAPDNDESGPDDTDGEPTGTGTGSRVRWAEIGDIIGDVSRSGFPSWVVAILAALLVSSAGATVQGGWEAQGLEHVWLGVALCLSFGLRFAIRAVTTGQVPSLRAPSGDTGRVAGVALLGLSIAAVAAAEPGLPYMGVGFVAFVGIALLVTGIAFAVVGAFLGTAVGGFAVGGLLALAAMVLLSPFDPDSFQATLFQGGIAPYPFVSPHRVLVVNLGFLVNLALLLVGGGALVYACGWAARVLLWTGAGTAAGQRPSAGTVWTVVPAVPTTVAIDSVLSGAGVLDTARGLAAAAGLGTTGIEAMAIAAVVVVVAWGISIRLVVGRESTTPP